MTVVPFQTSPGRELTSWIDYFLEYTDGIQSPSSFREWAAISTIAAALERKVHLVSQGRPVYPNLYIFLVGPPGSGKTRAVDECEDLLRSLKDHRIAPTSLTKAALIDALKEADRAVPGQMDGTFNALYVACKELGALVPGYDTDFMSALVYLYDSVPYHEKRRSKDTDFVIKNPLLNLIACTQPSYLNEMLPPGAWEQGFLSRTIIIYSDILDIIKLDLLGEAKSRDPAIERALKKDLIHIGSRVGRFQFEREAAGLLEAWNLARREHEPSHPRLTHYNTRRPIHLLKLCQIAAADRGAPVIGVPDVQRAQDWLAKAEFSMPDIFLAMSSGGDARTINELHHYVIIQQVRTASPVPLQLVLKFLHGRVPAHNVNRVVALMLNSGLLEGRPKDCVWAKEP